MKHFKILLLTSLVVLLTTYANASTINMAPIITYLLSDNNQVVPQPDPLPENITINNEALQSIIASIFDNTPYTPTVDIQGLIDTEGLTVTIPYTVVNSPVTLPVYSTSVILNASVTQDNEVDIEITFAWEVQPDLPVGSGTFTATITIDDSAGNTDNIYYAKKLDIQDDIAGLTAATFTYATDHAGNTGTLTLKIYPGIPDRMFGLPDNTGNTETHKFLYLPVTNIATGKIWLNNNLGANYANTNSSEFNITQQATSSTDYNAYGSLFQWGRKADGHELINWVNGSIGTGINGTTTINSNNPTDALFILESTFPDDWRINQDNTLWASESSKNNVCPIGYSVPTGDTDGELDMERQSWATSNSTGAMESPLKLPMPGNRYHTNGAIAEEGTIGIYWGSTSSNTYSNALMFGGSTSLYSSQRARAVTVRCIKD